MVEVRLLPQRAFRAERSASISLQVNLIWSEHQPWIRYPRRSLINTEQSTLDTQHSTLNTQHSTLNAQHSTLNRTPPTPKQAAVRRGVHGDRWHSILETFNPESWTHGTKS